MKIALCLFGLIFKPKINLSKNFFLPEIYLESINKSFNYE